MPNFGNGAIVGETFHRGFMAAVDRPVHRLPGRDRQDRPVDAAAREAGQPVQVELRHAERPSADYTKYDTDIAGWVDTLVQKGPWDTDPVPLVAGGPEKLPS